MFVIFQGSSLQPYNLMGAKKAPSSISNCQSLIKLLDINRFLISYLSGLIRTFSKGISARTFYNDVSENMS